MLHRVAQRVKRLPAMWETWVRSLGREDPLEKEMETHPSTLAWRIPWMEEPGRLQSMGLQRVSVSMLIWYCISYKCTIELFTVFRGYNPFTIFINYWLYSLHYTIYPCSLFSTWSFVPLKPLSLHCPPLLSPLAIVSLFSVSANLLLFGCSH